MASDHARFIAFARRIIRRTGERAAESDPSVLADLLSLRADIDAAAAVAVRGLIADGYSWADVARPLGITRQAAWQQYGKGRK